MGQHNNSSWQIQEASAKFSQLVEQVKETGPQMITKRGDPIAVVISKERYDELTKPTSSLVDFFKSAPLPEIELDLTRSKDLPRDIDL